jgi:hypothetical protein
MTVQDKFPMGVIVGTIMRGHPIRPASPDQYVVAVADTRSFRKPGDVRRLAAVAVGAARPVRARVGVTVFARTKRKVLRRAPARRSSRAPGRCSATPTTWPMPGRLADPFAGASGSGSSDHLAVLLPRCPGAADAACAWHSLDRGQAPPWRRAPCRRPDAALVARGELATSPRNDRPRSVVLPCTRPFPLGVRTGPPARAISARACSLDDGHCFRDQALAGARAPARGARLPRHECHAHPNGSDGAGVTLLPPWQSTETRASPLRIRQFGHHAGRTIALVWRRHPVEPAQSHRRTIRDVYTAHPHQESSSRAVSGVPRVAARLSGRGMQPARAATSTTRPTRSKTKSWIGLPSSAPGCPAAVLELARAALDRAHVRMMRPNRGVRTK